MVSDGGGQAVRAGDVPAAAARGEGPLAGNEDGRPAEERAGHPRRAQPRSSVHGQSGVTYCLTVDLEASLTDGGVTAGDTTTGRDGVSRQSHVHIVCVLWCCDLYAGVGLPSSWRLALKEIREG